MFSLTSSAISVVTFQQQREKQDGRKVYSARSGTAPSDSLGAFHISDWKQAFSASQSLKLISHFVAELEIFVPRCITTGATEEAKCLVTAATNSTNVTVASEQFSADGVAQCLVKLLKHCHIYLCPDACLAKPLLFLRILRTYMPRSKLALK